MGMPESVGESSVPCMVEVGTTDELGLTDPATCRFELLSPEQLKEVASVYNAWRVGNLQDCTFDCPETSNSKGDRMKIFTARPKQLIGTADRPVSWAPRDLLFEAQRHFLERLFDSSDIRGREVKVEVPNDGGPILFKCEVSLRNNPHTTISYIADADWGDFDVKAVRIRESDEHDLAWLDVTFVVDLRDARYPKRGRAK